MKRRDEIKAMQDAIDAEDAYIAKLQKEAPKCKKCGIPMLQEACDHCEEECNNMKNIIRIIEEKILKGEMLSPYAIGTEILRELGYEVRFEPFGYNSEIIEVRKNGELVHREINGQ